MNIEELSKLSINNKNNILDSVFCGCYYCLKIFDPKDIKEWVDKSSTAICPFCKIDAVIPDNRVEINEELLTEAKKYWF